MTVKELRERLANLDDNTQVFIEGEEFDYEEMTGYFHVFNDRYRSDVVVLTSAKWDYLE